MRYLPGDAHLIAKAGQRCLIHVRRPDKFQRDRLIENEVVGAIHLAIPP